MNSKRHDLDMFFQTGLNTSVLKYRWEETGLHGKVTETANDWNDIGRERFNSQVWEAGREDMTLRAWFEGWSGLHSQ